MDKEKRNQLRAESDRIQLARMGVFQVKNKINGKILLESSTNPETKWGRIKMELQNGSYYLRGLQEDWQRCGEENFTFEVIDRLEPAEGQSLTASTQELKVMLELWLDKLQPYEDKGYNRRRRG